MNLSLDYGAIEGSHELKKGILSLYQSGDDEEIAICHGGVNANELVLMTLLSTNDHILSFFFSFSTSLSYSVLSALGVAAIPLDVLLVLVVLSDNFKCP